MKVQNRLDENISSYLNMKLTIELYNKNLINKLKLNQIQFKEASLLIRKFLPLMNKIGPKYQLTKNNLMEVMLI